MFFRTREIVIDCGYFYNLEPEPWTSTPDPEPKNLDPENLDPENLDPEKPAPWKAWNKYWIKKYVWL